MSQTEDSHEMVPIHICTDDSEAEVIIGLLDSNGIKAYAGSSLPHDLYPSNADAPKIYVNGNDADKAIEIIEEHLEDGDPEFALEEE